MSFDPTKPVKMRGGQDAGIYTTEAGGCFPIHGWFKDERGQKIVSSWKANGLNDAQGITESEYDLVNVPEPEFWSKPEHFPPVCWMMRKGSGSSNLVIYVSEDVLQIGSSVFEYSSLEMMSWSDRPFSNFEDGKPCVVEGGAA